MFDTVSTRMPRTVRSPLTRETLDNIEAFALGLDRSGANSRSIVRDASNDDLRIQLKVSRPARAA